MIIDRIWAMPNKWTFTIKPIRELINSEWTTGVWVDPFAGENSPAQITNDLNPVRPTTHHKDALEFLKGLESESVEGILFDPPYSITQAKECYDEFGADKLDVSVTSMQYWGDCKTEMARILKPGGKVLCFGWNSMGIGINRGFEMTRVLIVPHGGSKNDTICTVEIKKHIPKDNQVELPLAALKQKFEVKQFTDYHYRINGVLDIFPTNRNYHDIKNNKRGGFNNMVGFVESFFKTEKPLRNGRLSAPIPGKEE